MESVRVQLSGNRISVYGRIVAAATDIHPAFSASYDLVTDESGATKRLSLYRHLAQRERQLSIARDEENMAGAGPPEPGPAGGLQRRPGRRRGLLSPFFNARCPSGVPACTTARRRCRCPSSTSGCRI